MKKYWQLLLIAVVIVVAISVHYIQVANASNQSYKLSFEKVSGDEKYVDSLKIEGSYQTGYSSNPVIITKDETKIKDNLLRDYTTLTIRELINTHKSFMRGKMRSESNFYEDDAQLIYAKDPDETWKLNEGESYTYDIDILNKNENKTVSFSVSSKLTKPVSWISVNNTVLVNNELKLITTHTRNNGDNEIHLVIIDLKKQQLLNDIILDTTASNENMRTYYQSYNDHENYGQEKYFVYSMNTQNEMPPYNIISQQFKIINIETNEITDLDVPESVIPESNMGVVDNNYFVISNRENANLVLYRYNIGQKRWLEPVTVTEPVKVLNKDSYTIQATNGKIYLFNEVDQGYLLQISDIENNQLLYEGILTKADNKQKFNLSIYHFYERNE